MGSFTSRPSWIFTAATCCRGGLSNTLTGDFCVNALEATLADARPEIFNTDQGVQFMAIACTLLVETGGVAISMDDRGRALDDVFIERL